MKVCDRPGKNISGFTLIELMFVIIIIAILASISIPTFYRWLPKYKLRAATRDLYSNFQLAKLTAIKRNTNSTITFDQPINGITYDYVVYVDSDRDLEYDAGEEVITKVLLSSYGNVSYDISQGGGDGITFTNNDDGLPSIAFIPDGRTRDNGGGFGTGSVFLKNKQVNTIEVFVSSVGNIRIE